jgi:hypothetical protein
MGYAVLLLTPLLALTSALPAAAETMHVLNDELIGQILKPSEPRELSEPKRGSCALGARPDVACLSVTLEGGCYEADFQKPYPLPNLQGQTTTCERQHALLHWVPTTEVGELGLYSELLGPKAAFSTCQAGTMSCYEAFDTNTVTRGTTSVRGIALCQRQVVENVKGPPENCRLASVRVNDRVLLPGIAHVRVSSPLGLVPEDRIRLFVSVPLDAEQFLAAIRRGLQSGPLKLVTDARVIGGAMSRHASSVIGVSGARRSPDYRLWEDLMVRAQQYSPPTRIEEQFNGVTHYQHTEYEISFTVVVNEQATSRPEDWHLPSEYQRNRYRASVRLTVGDALASQCGGHEWWGPDLLVCTGIK